MTASTSAGTSAPASALHDGDADPERRARLARIYLQLRPAVLARCRFILGDLASAEDATQDTFLRLHRHTHRAPGGADLRPWVLRIATNICLSELRSSSRRLRRQALDGQPSPATLPGRSPADLQLVERILLAAEGPVQLVVRLCCFDGIEQAVAARTLGVSQRTVAARLARFRRQLRRALREEARTLAR